MTAPWPTIAEWSGVALGLIYLLLAIREQRSCWVAGAAASALFLGVFWRAGLPMQSLLQVYYIAVAVHGWIHWSAESDSGSAPAAVHRAPLRMQLISVTLLLALATGSVLFQDAASSLQGWLDSGTSWGGVIATWLVARKVLDAWLYWIVIDAVTAALYFQTGLLASSALYILYAVLAFIAWRTWQQSYHSASAS